jgi:hypothetical protein
MRIDVLHRDDRGLQSVVGAVVVFVLTRLWWSGVLTDWFSLSAGWFRGDDPQAFSSATFAVVELLTSLIYGVGTVAILLWSGVLWFVKDIAAAVRLWREKQEPSREPIVVNVSDPGPVDEIYTDPVIDAIETLAGTVKELLDRIEAIEARPAAEAKPAAKPRARRTNA